MQFLRNSWKKYLAIQVIFICVFGFLALFYHSISITNATLLYKEDKTKPLNTQAILAKDGVRVILRELIRGKYYDMQIKDNKMYDVNPKLENHAILEINKVSIKFLSNKQFSNNEYIGKIDYTAKLTKRGYISIIIAWILCSVITFILTCFTLSQVKDFLLETLRTNTNYPKSQIVMIASLGCLALYYIYIPFDSTVIKLGIYPNDVGDMQWFPSTQFWGLHGYDKPINPFQEALNGNKFLANTPNYGHLLYILMYPFAIFSFDIAKKIWVVFNNLCIFAVFYYIFQFFKKNNYSLVIFAGVCYVFFSSYAYQSAIFRGNIPLVLCFFTALAFLYRNNFLILTLSLSILCTKYSFGVPIMIGFFLAGYYRAVICAGIINILAVILFAFEFNLSFIDSLFSPLKLGLTYASYTRIDLFTYTRFAHDNIRIIAAIILVFALIAWIALALRVRYNGGGGVKV